MAKPIFCVTHPRACSTAFERVFMTREDLTCIHEPFGDAFYYGPERLSPRYEKDQQARKDSGFADSTFQAIFDNIEQQAQKGKRLFIKDIIHYLFPPNHTPPQIAPSLEHKARGIGTQTFGCVNGAASFHASSTNGVVTNHPFPYGTQPEQDNPTVVPIALLRQFMFTFLIRDPHSSIPSYYRCTIPPLDSVTGFYEFYQAEAGYDEVRRMFDFAINSSQIGSKIAGSTGAIPDNNATTGQHMANGTGNDQTIDIVLVDADDLLDDPEGIMRQYCKAVGLKFDTDMLKWEDKANQAKAKEAFEKWKGFHEDAIDSTDLKPRSHGKVERTEDEWDAEWVAKYGEKGAKIIREAVDRNMADYLYLKAYRLKPTRQ